MCISVMFRVRIVICGAASLLVVMALLATHAQAAKFIGLGVLPGGIFESRGLGVSADGTVVVGESSNISNVREAFHWTEAGGMVGLGIPAIATSSAAFGASADGSTVVGSSGSGLPAEAFRWTEATGIVGLGYLNNNFQVSSASGVSADGSVVVGASRIGSAIGFFIPMEAFRWTEPTGMAGLGFLPTHGSSIANSVSADGTVIVGGSRPANTTDPGEAFRWTPGNGMVGLGQLGGIYTTSGASGVSADGAVVVGTASSDVSPQGDVLRQAFRWTEATGMVGLEHLPGDNGSSASDTSADGSIVVGDSLIGFTSQRAFIWDAAHGMRDLQAVLINDFGLGTSLAGWQLYSATAISDDGRVIVGTGLNPLGEREAWVAIIPEPDAFHLVICAGLVAAGLLLLKRVPRRATRATTSAVLFSTLLAAFIVCHTAAPSHAATLRTLHFEGFITASASSQVAVGISAVQQPAVTATGGGPAGVSQSTRGWSFTLSEAVTVTHLGILDLDFAPFPGVPPSFVGLLHDHDVAIWNADTRELLAKTTIPAGTGSLLLNRFRYEPITPLQLLPEQLYVIGKQGPIDRSTAWPSGDFIVSANIDNLTTAPSLTIHDGRFGLGDSLEFPGIRSALETTLAPVYIGPNFLFASDPLHVPEPAIVLLTISAAAVLLMRRRWGGAQESRR